MEKSFDYYILTIHRIGKSDVYFPKPSFRDQYGVDCTEDINDARRWLRAEDINPIVSDLKSFIWKYGAIGNDARWTKIEGEGFSCEIVGYKVTNQIDQYEKYEFKEGDVIVWKGKGSIVGKIQGVFAGAYHVCDGIQPSKGLCRPATADEAALIQPGKKFAKIRLPFDEMGHWVFENIWVCERIKGIQEYDTYKIDFDYSAYSRRFADIILEMEAELKLKGAVIPTEEDEE